MKSRDADYTLEFLLDFDGRIHHLEEGVLAQIRNQARQSHPETATRSVLFIHSSCAGWQAIDWLRQRPHWLGQNLSVQEAAACGRSLAPDRAGSRPAIWIQRR